MADATTTKPRTRRSRSATPRKKPAKAKRWRSRAVRRRIEAGSATSCVACEDHIKFKAKTQAEQVICNVYKKGVWDRVEHFHADCYDKAGAPYGTPTERTPITAR